MSKKMIHNLALNYIAFCLTFGENVTYADAVKMVKASNKVTKI